MNGISFGIYIPSYKRAETCTTHRLLEYGTYVVRKSEEELYREAFHRNGETFDILAVEDQEICGLVEVNQWIIDHAKEEVVAILDDDIRHFYYRLDRMSEIEEPETVTAELERIGQLMSDLNIGFGATDATCAIWNYTGEFEFKGTAGSVRFVNRRAFKAKCRKEVELNYDLDLELQELLKNRVILKPKYFCSKGLTDTNEGGASNDKRRKDQEVSVQLMKQKWGRYFQYNFKNNKPMINVKR